MQKQFNVGDTVKYTSPHPQGRSVIGVIKAVDTTRFNYGNWNDATAGLVTGVSKELVTFNVRWDDSQLTNVYEIGDSSLKKYMRRVNKVETVLKPTESTEEMIKNLIVHLVLVNETDRACEVIEVLRKYKNDQVLKKYELK